MRAAAPTGPSATLTSASESGGTVGRDGGTGGIGGTGGTGGGTGTGGIGSATRIRPSCRPTPRTAAPASTSASSPTRRRRAWQGCASLPASPASSTPTRIRANGCECTKTNSGVEICDGLDNDCNGVIDDGFDFMTDVNNCGACNHQCAFPFATATCVSGVCTAGSLPAELLRPRSHRPGLRNRVHQDKRRRRDLRRPRQRLRRRRRRQPRRADHRLPHEGGLCGDAADLLRIEWVGLQLPLDV